MQRTTLGGVSLTTEDGRLRRGRKTRSALLHRAADIASVDGLEGLTIGRLANELTLSKSGVFAHFASKEDLQLATVEAARAVFVSHVIEPTLTLQPGLVRVWELCQRRLGYMRSVFSGGCFFYGAGAEFDARPGRVRDALATIRRDWLRWLERELSEARSAGELRDDADLADLAFHLDALAIAANGDALLSGDDEPLRRAARLTLAALRDAALTPDALAAAAAPEPSSAGDPRPARVRR